MNKTDQIFRLTAPYDNPYQNFREYKRLLFVCSAGLLRSATGATIFSNRGFNTRTAGTHEYALVPLSVNLIEWADKIIFVNRENYENALMTFKDHKSAHQHLMATDITKVLDIPDQYSYMDPRLIRAFEEQLKLDD